MKKILLAACIVFGFQSVSAQTYTDAKSLLQATHEKEGGTKCADLKTIKMEGTMVILGTQIGDLDGTLTQMEKYPGYRVIDQSIATPMGPMTIKNVFTPEKAWTDNSMGGRQEMPKQEVTSACEEQELLAKADSTYKVSETTFEEKAVYALAYTKEEAQIVRYYDKTTLQLIASASKKDEGEATRYITEWANLNGVVIGKAFTVKQSAGGQELTVKVAYTTMEPNATLPDDAFSDN